MKTKLASLFGFSVGVWGGNASSNVYLTALCWTILDTNQNSSLSSLSSLIITNYNLSMAALSSLIITNYNLSMAASLHVHNQHYDRKLVTRYGCSDSTWPTSFCC